MDVVKIQVFKGKSTGMVTDYQNWFWWFLYIWFKYYNEHIIFLVLFHTIYREILKGEKKKVCLNIVAVF